MNKNNLFVMEHISKSYQLSGTHDPLVVLEDITLSIDPGEVVVLIGPSGCGKSTVLNIAAGFVLPDSGSLYFDGAPITSASSMRGVIVQSPVRFPWLNVRQNIEYGLKLKGLERKSLDERCAHIIDIVGLKGFEHYLPHQLSGGMQQRVSIARVLVIEPKMLLMDEPFASLDAQSRLSMQQLLLKISTELDPAILFITHDVEEALMLADTIYIMGNLPGRSKHKIEVPFKKPRMVAIIGTPKSSHMTIEILHSLFSEAIMNSIM